MLGDLAGMTSPEGAELASTPRSSSRSSTRLSRRRRRWRRRRRPGAGGFQRAVAKPTEGAQPTSPSVCRAPSCSSRPSGRPRCRPALCGVHRGRAAGASSRAACQGWTARGSRADRHRRRASFGFARCPRPTARSSTRALEGVPGATLPRSSPPPRSWPSVSPSSCRPTSLRLRGLADREPSLRARWGSRGRRPAGSRRGRMPAACARGRWSPPGRASARGSAPSTATPPRPTGLERPVAPGGSPR